MKRKLKEMNRLPAATTDGRQVALFANAGSLRDIELAKKHGAEGIGLFRSEFLYMESSRFPTEQEQFEIYKQAAEMLKKPITIRTLDIGGDKNLPYYQFEKEENPFLGWRSDGLRDARPAILPWLTALPLRRSARSRTNRGSR